MLTLKSLNREVKKLFPGYELVKGSDYFYIWGPDTEMWDSTMIYVAKLNHFTLDQWLDELKFKFNQNGRA